MREINDQYPEYARPYEPVKGGKHHNGLYGKPGRIKKKKPGLFLNFALIGLLLVFMAGMRPYSGVRLPERPRQPEKTEASRKPDHPSDPDPVPPEDVEIVPMLGPEFFGCPLEEFYAKLAAYEPQFIAREAELDAAGQRQRFVASLRRDPAARLGYRAEIRMQRVGPESPFYWISGTENVTVVHSEYSAPLVIKGAGEGVRLAATGIIKDILM